MSARGTLLGLGAALLLALLISPFASPRPDGLEKVAADKGFLHRGERKPPLTVPLPDYTWPGIRDARVATAVSGAFGTLAVFGIAWGAAALLRVKRDSARHVTRPFGHRE